VPFTPFHFGPALLAKGAAPKHVSLLSFAATQVAVDLEPLYYLVRNDPPIHRWAHTLWGAALVGLAVGIALARWSSRWTVGPAAVAREDLRMGPALTGGLIGGITHPLLDGLMHADVRALRPLAETTWVLDPAGVAGLHLGCVAAGALGAGLLLFRRAGV